MHIFHLEAPPYSLIPAKNSKNGSRLFFFIFDDQIELQTSSAAMSVSYTWNVISRKDDKFLNYSSKYSTHLGDLLSSRPISDELNGLTAEWLLWDLRR